MTKNSKANAGHSPEQKRNSVNLFSLHETHLVRFLLIIIISFLIFSYLHSFLKMVLVEKNFGDFANYYFFSKLANKGIDIYSIKQDDLGKIKQLSSIPVYTAGKAEYSLTFFLMMTPFTRFSFWSALILWLFINHIAMGLCLWFSTRIAENEKVNSLISFGIAIVAFFASQPVLECVSIGQVNILILVLLFLILHFHNRHNGSIISGVSLAIILLIKPQFFLLFLFFLFRRKFSFCVSAISSYLALHVLGAVVYGLPVELSYWQNLASNTLTKSIDLNPMNLSLKAMFARLFFGSLPFSLSTLAYVMIALALCFLTFKKVISQRAYSFFESYAVLICLILMVSPLTEEHHLILAIVPVVVALYRGEHSISELILLAASFVLINVRYSLVSYKSFDTGLLSLFAFGKMFGVFLLWYIFWRKRPLYHS